MTGSLFPKAYADLVARLRVPSGFLLVAAFAWLARPEPIALAAGVSVSACGLLLRGWAAGHLEKNRQLARSGPYNWVRNPLYIGTLLVAAGLVVSARRWELAIVFGAVFLLIYLPVIELEEQHLRRLFPEYAGYAAQVPKLLPRRPAHPSTGRFRWAVYKKNQEYQALLGYLAGLAWLIWKTIAR